MAKVKLKVSRRIQFPKQPQRELKQLLAEMGKVSPAKDFHVEVGLLLDDQGTFEMRFNVVREWRRGEAKAARKLMKDIHFVISKFTCPQGTVNHEQWLSM